MRGRVLLLASAAVVTGLLSAGCASGVSAGAVAGTTPPPTTTAVVSGTAAASKSASKSVPLRFANRTLSILLTGYNATAQMVQFQLAVSQSEPTDDSGYVPDPSDPATHQLPLDPEATVLSAVNYCPSPDDTPTIGPDGVGNGPCTMAKFLAALRATPALGAARVAVDGTDHIIKVSEIYHP